MSDLSFSILNRISCIAKNKVEFLKFNFFLFFKIAFLSYFISIFLISCKKETDLGLTTQPLGDKINTIFTDTLQIEAYTIKDDSASSLGSKNENYGLLGNYIDPEFGKSSASFLAQVLPKTTSIKFDSLAEIVSLKLYLDYTGNYGDSTKLQFIKVFKLSKSINKDSAYYSVNKASSYYNEDDVIGIKVINPSQLYSDKLEIDLSPSLGTEILNLDSITSNTQLLSILQGICITTDTSVVGGCIMYFNLYSGNSKMVLAYKKTPTSTNDTCEFIINQNSARFNLFTHDFTNTHFYNQLNSTNPIQDSVYYIQPMAGVRGFIKMPTADKLSLKKNAAIIKATLIVPIEKNDLTSSTYPVPTKLMLFARQADNDYNNLADSKLVEVFDGNHYPSESVYKFNITIQMQNIIDGNIPNLGYFLVSDNLGSSNRVVLNSAIHSNRLKLQISYIKF